MSFNIPAPLGQARATVEQCSTPKRQAQLMAHLLCLESLEEAATFGWGSSL